MKTSGADNVLILPAVGLSEAAASQEHRHGDRL